MNEHILSEPQDRLCVEPPAIETAFADFMMKSIAKQLAAQSGNLWTATQEDELDESMYRLLAQAEEQGLS